MKIGVLGSGSWGTALAKILTDNGRTIAWWNRSTEAIEHIRRRGHNPQYISSAKLQTNFMNLTNDALKLIDESEVIVVAIPSAYLSSVFSAFPKNILQNKKILSAVKGILPEEKILLNDYLSSEFNFPLKDYFAILGPCHAEEIAAEKLSYLTFTGVDEQMAALIADQFKAPYLHTVVSTDIYGVQYAAVLKNIYALGAGIANGLDYGDNFMSVLIANAADEMAGFLRKAGLVNAQVGYLDHQHPTHVDRNNYAASVYLGDLLVTCYSLHSRNRAFGNYIGRGYSVQAAQLEMNMVAEGYYASRCMHEINKQVGAEMPIATAVYNILWNNESPRQSFSDIEKLLV